MGTPGGSDARLLLVFGILLGAGLSARADGVDSPMYRDPEVPAARVVKTYPNGLADLWLAALGRPEADMQSQAALAIAAAHADGMPGLSAAVGPLETVLNRPDAHPAVRVAAARALVALDARSAAPALLRHARDGTAEFRAVVEPALARWDHTPARAVWLDRLGQPPPYGRSFLLAAQGLAAVREDKAAPRLRELVLAPDTPSVARLAAARALAEIRQAGSEADAGQLAADPSPRGTAARLAATSLLRRHQGGDTVRLLQGFATDAEPAVAAVAVARLTELDAGLILPVLEAVLSSPDAAVRTAGAEALLRRPSVPHVRRLGDLLADPHPDVRAEARQALRVLAAGPDLRTAVLEQGTRVLAAADWRGQEQAALLLAALGHTPAAGRLVELLSADRPEVFVTAAWGLRVLAVPETLPAVLAHVRRRHQELIRSGVSARLGGERAEAVARQLAQLAQQLGQARHRPADDALRQLVPRFLQAADREARTGPAFTPVGAEARAAAIWALGLIHEGKPQADLAEVIEDRLTGDGGVGPDDERVRRMAAVALGRMKATDSLPALRTVAGDGRPTTDVVVNACRWAVAHIAGQPPPAAGVVEVPQRDWFLVPIR